MSCGNLNLTTTPARPEPTDLNATNPVRPEPVEGHATICNAFIALGGNLGDVLSSFRFALKRLADHFIRVEQISPIYRTRSAIIADQPNFYNAVCQVTTELPPLTLLQCLLSIEEEAGRKRNERYAARTLDLDLLLYGKHFMQTPNLQLPHPRMHERVFVLQPLCDLAPEAIISTDGLTASKALAALPDPKAGIIATIPWL